MSLPIGESSTSHSLRHRHESVSSSYSVRDALESFRRSQYLRVNAKVASSFSDASAFEDQDEESAIGRYDSDEEAVIADDDDRTPGQGIVANFDWDEDEGVVPAPSSPATRPFSHAGPGELIPSAQLPSPPAGILQPASPPPVSDRTPLLHKTVSFSHDVHPAREHHEHHIPKARRGSASSAKSVKYHYTGKSTFGQTLFNSIAVLLGIGMLSEPLAFSYAGWIGGSLITISYGFVTTYTAKILGRIILSEPDLFSYADIGRKAFGPRSIPFISTMFCLELFTVSVALVTLSADSLHSILPMYSSNAYKLWGAFVLIPTVFLPLSLLSYTSILGIMSSIFIVGVVLTDGLSKKEAPGSIWQPAETSISFSSLPELGLSFGLVMAGFSGHAVIPSLARDMIDPSQFEIMIDYAFAVATAIYAVIGATGYLMFGRDVHDEISIDLNNTPGYNPTLNHIALWIFVLSPLTKFALATRPVMITLEIAMGLEPRLPPVAPDDQTAKPRTLTIHGHPPGERYLHFRRVGVVLERCAFTLASIAVSIFVPEFSSLMAFIGAFSAFLLCVIGPLLAKIALERKCSLLDATLLTGGIVMAIWGTGAAFWSAGA